ncbi:sorbosone dehydrogenase family protein [Erythrobacter arachoides]|uniref:Sorbosone dehydrogenase family protein n=1 Tax=Aurantiacibacter arachoides TaxID=1850444 RepID=A0A845A3G6_9SPHN|nr:sorbosone dehydrogenase family protein [Aurantiacibacter arachoides]MXO94655.1 sorbosone dehydrogenase family protein [Aurantiacibacter arachoides]GGD61790.1 sorbosone dehydrogenase [Aurantiacibacter arachoides]
MSTLKKILLALLVLLLVGAAVVWWMTRPVEATIPLEETTGTDPTLVEPDPQTFPTVGVVEPIGWDEGETPTAADGLVVNRFADNLEHPRVIHTLPNGDVLVTLTNAPDRPVSGGWLTNLVASFLFSKAGAAVPSPNQLVLLRDADGDGAAEERHVLREADLSSPSGIAWADGKLYVANHDAVLRFDYALGDNAVTGAPEKIADLPAAGNHWMRNLLLSDDGTRLFVAVGSASNIGEGGMAIEENRAAIHELYLPNLSARLFGAGLRNPNGMAINPWTGELWTTVNERDMLGSDLVPDYMTNVPIGANYGWPWVYYGSVVDERVEAPMPRFLTDYSRTPEYALGAHVAALGLVFSAEGNRMGMGQGAFIARHGSWNRVPQSGYDVVFVAFDDRGNPTGKPMPVLTDFLVNDEQTRGRPTWLAWDRTGALLVSDDTANIIWRVQSPGAAAGPAIQRNQGERLPPRRQLQGDPRRAFEEGAVPMTDVM